MGVVDAAAVDEGLLRIRPTLMGADHLVTLEYHERVTVLILDTVREMASC